MIFVSNERKVKLIVMNRVTPFRICYSLSRSFLISPNVGILFSLSIPRCSLLEKRSRRENMMIICWDNRDNYFAEILPAVRVSAKLDPWTVLRLRWNVGKKRKMVLVILSSVELKLPGRILTLSSTSCSKQRIWSRRILKAPRVRILFIIFSCHFIT